MRILITGATGLLGSSLSKLLSGHHEVVGWVRGLKPSPVPLESVDITGSKVVLERMRRLHPDLVIHTAAMTDLDACQVEPDLAMRINAEGTANVALGCQSVGADLIALSTDYVFDGSIQRPHREEDPTNPLSVYARSKLLGEQAVLRSPDRFLVLRVSGLFGSARPNFISHAALQLKAAKPLTVVANQRYSPTYVEDLARGIEKLLGPFREGRVHGVLHLANAGGTSRLELVRTIADFLGVEDPDSLMELTSWEAMQRPALRPVNSRLDCSRFAELVGAPLRSWADAVLAFLKQELFHLVQRS